MSASINRVFLAGRLTSDPQVKFLANEKAVANFGLAVNHKYKGADGTPKEDVTFIDVEAWGRTAELVGQYLAKGRSCFIEGRLKLDTWEDKEGKKQSKLRVSADSVQFLDSAQKDGQAPAAAAPSGETAQPQRPSRPAPAAGDDEPPF